MTAIRQRGLWVGIDIREGGATAREIWMELDWMLERLNGVLAANAS